MKDYEVQVNLASLPTPPADTAESKRVKKLSEVIESYGGREAYMLRHADGQWDFIQTRTREIREQHGNERAKEFNRLATEELYKILTGNLDSWKWNYKHYAKVLENYREGRIQRGLDPAPEPKPAESQTVPTYLEID